MQTLVGGILVGGKGRRLGGMYKGLLQYKGNTILQRTLTLLAPFCRDIFLLGDATAYEAYPVRALQDRLPAGGPLCGIDALLHESASDILILPCDLPLLNADVLQRLVSAPILVPRGCRTNTRRHPLVSIWPTHTASIVARCAAANESVQHAFEACKGKWIDYPEERPFFNVNTPQQLAKLC